MLTKEKINMIIQHIAKYSLVAAVLSFPGFFSFFYGTQLMESQDAQNIFFWFGAVILSPMLFTKYIFDYFHFQMGLGIVLMAQSLGYSLIGAIYIQLLKLKKKS